MKGTSVLRASALDRLAVTLAITVALWIGVAWALGWS